ncbi:MULTISPECIES: staphylopine uptake ABC transporter permease subunit CntC [Brevibacillus]|jgi:nickel transport system permease protein|uniref:Nickel ABC transporter permease n=1 Tax=Brevibacillus parabrevis TaxID=54914 RepID=A0A4Y3PJZ7_BREPA|nr:MULTISPECIES: nickel/cobalt ABC transporter permease [Brevibacillus]MDH6353320.1 nickel transport system permease protein [Brevibacillus sp. 1238]MDR5001563.1 ABC transporter permease subunit [Brevibacillus parabrevis]MED2253519.1 ABC transporter permease subunit [Brevibacillus parabrevis]NRQ56360.1 ABC transporter permease subunit [Brevibacillus sp. HD1.4A]RNB97601.1 ABC transporter permease subunit [Brevibacillus parabrevis]
MKWLKNALHDKVAMASFTFLVLIAAAGIFAPFLAPHDPKAVHMDMRFAPASWEYPLGNDQLGRCVLSRLIYGIRPSLLWVLAALVLSVGIGGIVGFVAGYFRGRLDAVLMRLCDVMLSFPGYVMTLAIIGIMGVGLENILIAFVLSKWPWFARVIRTSVRQYAEADYVRFAKAIGISDWQIMTRHIALVATPDIAVIASSSLGSMILQISGFSFLGLGIQAPNAEWGMMLSEAREVMFSRPELMLAPGLAIVLTVCAVNFLADALQTALDPKLGRSRQKPQALVSALDTGISGKSGR